MNPLKPLLLALCAFSVCPHGANAQEVYTLPDGSEVRPLEQFQDCARCPEMIVLPLGIHDLGSSEQEQQDAYLRVLANRSIEPGSRAASYMGTFENEGPEHSVTMDLPIAMGRHEVTRQDWAVCVAADRCFADHDVRIRQRLPDGPYQDDPRSPIIGITFLEMQDYVGWLNNLVGAEVYRLPTEVEWEFAARAGADTIYGQGDKVSRDQANFLVGWRGGDPLEWIYDPANERMPISVDRLDATNSWGFRHMTGNVSEITLSCYSVRHLGFDSARRYLASTFQPLGCKRVIKGGSYNMLLDLSRPERRNRWAESSWSDHLGFRLVRELDVATSPSN